jgi:CBS domain-containing protein
MSNQQPSQRNLHPRPYHRLATVMSWPVATIDHDASLEEGAEALAADEVGAVLVLADGALVGVLSERDVVRHLAAGATLSHLRVSEAMTQELTTAQVDDTVLDAARAMREADVRHLPVLQDNLLAGMVSIRDLFGVLLDVAGEDDVVVVPSGTRVVVRQS